MDALLNLESGNIKLKLGEVIPYQIGTAEADAWFSGVEEGKRRWRNYLEDKSQNQNSVLNEGNERVSG